MKRPCGSHTQHSLEVLSHYNANSGWRLSFFEQRRKTPGWRGLTRYTYPDAALMVTLAEAAPNGLCYDMRPNGSGRVRVEAVLRRHLAR
jgi:hypothetical protein